MRVLRVALVVAVFAACGYDWTVVPKGDAGTTTLVDASTDSSASPTVDAGAPLVTCRSTKDCPEDKYCAFPDRRCGNGATGTCVATLLTTACLDADIEIVCTCDDHVWKSRCQAASYAIDLSVNAACPFDDGYARCGFLYCVAAKETCATSNDGGVPDYRCVPR